MDSGLATARHSEMTLQTVSPRQCRVEFVDSADDYIRRDEHLESGILQTQEARPRTGLGRILMGRIDAKISRRSGTV